MAAPESRYTQYYSTAPDPLQGNYTAAYDEFLPVAPPTAGALFRAVGDPDSSGVFAYLGRDGRIHTIHSLRRHGASAFGQARSPFLGRTIGVLDERTNVGASFVEVFEGLFGSIREHHIRLAADITAAYAADQNLEQLEAVDPANPGNSDEVHTRHCILVPHAYVPRLLQATCDDGGGIVPRTFWEHLETMVQLGLYHASYNPFHNWARMAVSNGIGNANDLQAQAAWEPRLVAPDASLGASRTNMELALFPPAAATAAMAPTIDLQGVVDTLAAMRNDATHRANDTAEEKAAEKARKASPTARWGTARVQRLCNLCQCRDETELPPVYLEMAANGAKHDHHTIESYASAEVEPVVTRHNVVRDYNLHPFQAPVISQALSRCVGSLDFGNKRDNLIGALVIFMLSYPDQDGAAAAKEVNDMLFQHVETNVQVTVADLQGLSKNQATKMPKNYEQLRNILVGYHRFQQVLLGDRHDVPKELRLFVNNLKHAQGALEKKCLNNPYACAQVLRLVQLHTWEWVMFQEKTDEIVRPPDYASIASDIMLRQWPSPDFPPGFEAVPRHPSTAPTSGQPVAAPPSATGLSAATAPTAAARWIPGDEVNLPAEQKAIGVFDPSVSKADISAMGKLKRTHFCLSYHVRGSCFANCGRKADHILHNTDQTTRLATYLVETKALLSA
jgi:hypothetical protein